MIHLLIIYLLEYLFLKQNIFRIMEENFNKKVFVFIIMPGCIKKYKNNIQLFLSLFLYVIMW